ncbi:aldolase/citrate lyase family protein [Verrucomicrobia bacterium]|nr:aldolase/citrate lyase family protein [Verrucomicrobiota bacterium]
MIRSFHFIPGNRKNLFSKIQSINADGIIFDLEDAVPAGAKVNAAEHILEYIRRNQTLTNIYVRIEPLFPEATEVLSPVINESNIGIVLPKIESKGQIQSFIDEHMAGSHNRIIAIIETYKGLTKLPEIAEHEQLVGLGIGFEDLFSTDIFTLSEFDDFAKNARFQLALHAKTHELYAIDGISTEINDFKAIKTQVLQGRSCGMTSQFTIHPNQIDIVNQVYSPSKESMVEAKLIASKTNLKDEIQGYQRIDDLIISPPKIKKAKHILKYL